MILEKIATATRQRVEAKKKSISMTQITHMADVDLSRCYTLEKALRKENISFICEIKKGSPSRGIIAEDFPYLQIAVAYEGAGAAAISVLTEPDFFQGCDEYLFQIRKVTSLPLLRKDFTIDPYQIYEAKVIGADAILLLCSLLDTAELREYLEICHGLGMSALVEAHDEYEIESALAAGARIIGVNNRNLKDFSVDIGNSLRLRKYVPPGVLYVAESGIKTRQDVAALDLGGVHGVLIGETLMRSLDKRKCLQELRGHIA